MTGERPPEPEPKPSDVVEGEIGEARLREPDEIEKDGAGADLEAIGVRGPDDPLKPTDEDEQTEMDRHREAGDQAMTLRPRTGASAER